MQLVLTDNEKATLLRISPHKEGHSYFSLCPTCGRPEWISTTTTEETGISATVSSMSCGACHEVNRRAPEVVEWVLRVLTWRARLNNEKEPPANAEGSLDG